MVLSLRPKEVSNLYHGIYGLTLNIVATSIIPDPATMRAFIGVYLTIAPSQYIFAILPLVLVVQLTKFTPAIFAYGRNNAALIENSITTPTILRYVPQLAKRNPSRVEMFHHPKHRHAVVDLIINEPGEVLHELSVDHRPEQGVRLTMHVLGPIDW